MSATLVSSVVFLCVLGGAVLGTVLRPSLPSHHLSDESKDTIKFGTGVLATLVALVLGLLIASAKSSFDTKSDELKVGAANIILLDHYLRRIGPPADKSRLLLRRAVAYRVAVPWGEQLVVHGNRASGPAEPDTLQDVEDEIRGLASTGAEQQAMQSRALELSTALSQTRWLILEQAASAVSTPILVVVVSWLVVIFASFGLLAPRNVTVWVVIVLCAVSVSTSVFLILELDQPFGGLITLSKEPLSNALQRLDR